MESSKESVSVDQNSGLQSFKTVLAKEREYLSKRRVAVGLKPDLGGLSQTAFCALALSGGGIRSASFALGVMQYLAKRDYLKRFDYLSTVSGGGYIGSSLMWLLHQKRHDPAAGEDRFLFNTSSDGFPYGALKRDVPQGTEGKSDTLGESQSEAAGIHSNSNDYQWALLDRLRQRGNYLSPGAGITIFSLLSTLIRGSFLSLLTFFPLLTVFFMLMQGLAVVAGWLPYELTAAHWVCVLIIVLAFANSLWYAFQSLKRNETNSAVSYSLRRDFERRTGMLLVAFLVLLFLGLIPIVHQLFENPGSIFKGRETQLGFALSTMGMVATGIGYSADKSKLSKTATSIKQQLWPWLAAGSLLFGLLLLSHLYAVTILGYFKGFPLLPSDQIGGLLLFVAVLAAGLFVGRFPNINYLTLHRYYRDRLMEVFLPNADIDSLRRRDCDKGANEADEFCLSDLENSNPIAPLHLINANVVLSDSVDRKCAGRGGDSFVLSARFSGSKSTGWCKTTELADGNFSLATAMASAGAAANPNTGVGGEGPFRNPAYSLLMSLLNIRLALWIANPWFVLSFKKGRKRSPSPTFYDPVLSCLLSGLKSKRPKKDSYSGRDPSFAQDEFNKYLEISDGGHFENLGLYELVRRRVKTILLLDAGADPDYQFSDIANAIEKVRVDFGVSIDIRVDDLTPTHSCNPHGICYSKTAVVSGDINYPDGQQGKLIFLKTCFTQDLPPDLISYKITNPSFPDQSTGDQFFDEKQFEAYRELGYALARELDKELIVAEGSSEGGQHSVDPISLLFPEH